MKILRVSDQTNNKTSFGMFKTSNPEVAERIVSMFEPSSVSGIKAVEKLTAENIKKLWDFISSKTDSFLISREAEQMELSFPDTYFTIKDKLDMLYPDHKVNFAKNNEQDFLQRLKNLAGNASTVDMESFNSVMPKHESAILEIKHKLSETKNAANQALKEIGIIIAD